MLVAGASWSHYGVDGRCWLMVYLDMLGVDFGVFTFFSAFWSFLERDTSHCRWYRFGISSFGVVAPVGNRVTKLAKLQNSHVARSSRTGWCPITIILAIIPIIDCAIIKQVRIDSSNIIDSITLSIMVMNSGQKSYVLNHSETHTTNLMRNLHFDAPKWLQSLAPMQKVTLRSS